MNCGNEMKKEMIVAVNAIYIMQLHKEAWKKIFRTNPWPCDTDAMLYQLSCEATDVWSRSIVGSYVSVKEMSVNDIWNKSYMNCGNEMKMKKWSSQWMQFMQLRKEAWKKFRTSTGLEPVTSRYRCNALPTELWSHHWSPEFFFQACLRNSINCIHCDHHFFIFISFPQFIYDLFHISLTLISFTGTYEPTIDLLPTSVAS